MISILFLADKTKNKKYFYYKYVAEIKQIMFYFKIYTHFIDCLGGKKKKRQIYLNDALAIINVII
jgi:hypothetical protein